MPKVGYIYERDNIKKKNAPHSRRAFAIRTNLTFSCNLCHANPRVVGNDLGIEVRAVELVRAEDLLTHIDLCSECSAENLFVKTDRFTPHAVFLDDVRKDVVVLFESADRPDDVVVMFHYSHGCKF